MKCVTFTNLRNEHLALDRDGIGSKVHLTDSDTAEGKTLCGRHFSPLNTAVSSTNPFRCQRCLKSAYKRGYPKGFTKGLGWIE